MMINETSSTVRTLAVDGTRFAYRVLGGRNHGGTPPLVLFQRFRGTMDDWDPALLDRLAADRPVIIFDNAGVGRSSGESPSTVGGMAERAAAFIEGLGLGQVDILGWSMGDAIAQRLALDRPAMLRKLVLAGTGPGGVPDAPALPARVLEIMRKPVNDDEDFTYLFFNDSPRSRGAAATHLQRLRAAARPPGPPVAPDAVRAQLAAVVAWAAGKDSAYARLGELGHPTLVANGAHDIMTPAYSSYVMSQRIPAAELVLYPDAGHGFLFQHAARFSRHVAGFLND